MRRFSSDLVELILLLTENRDKFDAIVAFGYGPVQVGFIPGVCRLNLYGRINAIATGILYQILNIERIIPTGGRTGGSDKPSEAELMAQMIQSKFGIPESVFILEEEAMDTIYNIVHVANIIDQSPQLEQNLLFVAMGFHLPRIREICSLLRINGSFIAAEAVVKLRSQRHPHLLFKLLHPDNINYASMLESQERGLRGIREIPEYWIPPLGTLNNTQRLREILANAGVQFFLKNHDIDTNSLSAEALHQAISLIPRKFPD